MGEGKISIIIPVKPGGTVKAMEALGHLEYPDQDLEILIAEGKCPSRQRNLAAAAAGGEILYFFDDDSLPLPRFLIKTLEHFQNPSTAVVGGPSLTPESDSLLQQLFGLALSSPFGSGGVCNRYRKKGTARETGDHELILCNLSIRSEIFRDCGGFDERLYPNEENELMVRIQRQGMSLVHDPELAVYRSQRRTFGAFVRQMFGYGKGRGRQTLIGGVTGIGSFIPLFFMLYVVSLFFVPMPVYYLPLLCYMVIGLGCAFFESFRAGRSILAPALFFLYPVIHFCYGAGIIWGLLSYGGAWKNRCDSPVTLRRVKEFGRPL